jgi:DNA mismatch repair protein MutL
METRIQVIPHSLANQIAAGEVVERPSSVVKELIENALDAGARFIEIEVSGGGMKRILVADDGEGIFPEDAPLAFRRHATSKIRRVEDLHALSTLGFRGEALPSIASVGRVTLITRRRSAGNGNLQGPSKKNGANGAGSGTTGVKVVVEGGQEIEVREAPAPPGTAVEVRDLFYNTPARKKFLKTEGTELSRIVEAATNAALAFPNVGFKVKNEKRTLLDLPPADRGGRVRALLPDREAQGLFSLPVSRESQAGSIRVEGFASLPAVHRAGRSCQHVVINGRTVRDRVVVNAAYDVYRGLVPSGRHPLFFLFVTMDPQDVDVNVHPAKTEVRFRDSGRVFGAVRRALAEGLVQASGVAGVTETGAADAEVAEANSSGRVVSEANRSSEPGADSSSTKVYPLRRP